MKLRKYLELNGIKHAYFAKQLGITPTRLTIILKEETDILLSTAVAIEKATCGHVTCKDLAVPPKRKKGGRPSSASQDHGLGKTRQNTDEKASK